MFHPDHTRELGDILTTRGLEAHARHYDLWRMPGETTRAFRARVLWREENPRWNKPPLEWDDNLSRVVRAWMTAYWSPRLADVIAFAEGPHIVARAVRRYVRDPRSLDLMEVTWRLGGRAGLTGLLTEPSGGGSRTRNASTVP